MLLQVAELFQNSGVVPTFRVREDVEPGTCPSDESDVSYGFARIVTCSAQTFSESLSARVHNESTLQTQTR